LIADTPGSFMPVIRDAISVADCIVMPIQPSPLDLLAHEDLASIVKRLGKVDRTLFAVNRLDPRSSIGAEMRASIGQLPPSAPAKIRQRVSYARSLTSGLGAGEIDGEASKEIMQLWTAIQTLMRKHDENVETAGHGGFPRVVATTRPRPHRIY